MSFAGLAAHSGASGRVRCEWVLGTRVDSGDIRGNSPVTRDTWRTRRLPGKYHSLDFTAHSGASGEACGFGTRGQVSCSEGDSEGGVSKGFRLACGTRGTLQRG